jgi:hypothetical protein
MSTKNYCDRCGEEMPNLWSLYAHTELNYNKNVIVKKKIEKERQNDYIHGTYCEKCTPVLLDEIYAIFTHVKRP